MFNKNGCQGATSLLGSALCKQKIIALDCKTTTANPSAARGLLGAG